MGYCPNWLNATTCWAPDHKECWALSICVCFSLMNEHTTDLLYFSIQSLLYICFKCHFEGTEKAPPPLEQNTEGPFQSFSILISHCLDTNLTLLLSICFHGFTPEASYWQKILQHFTGLDVLKIRFTGSHTNSVLAKGSNTARGHNKV